ncbi:MAG: hypothetical protein AAB875_04420 [Patescibacteria group bacterium]
MVNPLAIVGLALVVLVPYLLGKFKEPISGFTGTIVSGAITGGEAAGRFLGSPLYAAGAGISQIGAASKYLQDVIAQLIPKVREETTTKYPPDWTEEDIRRGYKIKPESEDIRDGARVDPYAGIYDPFNVGSLVVPTGGPHAGLLGEIYQELRRGSIPQYFVRGVDQYYSQDYSPAEVRAGARV